MNALHHGVKPGLIGTLLAALLIPIFWAPATHGEEILGFDLDKLAKAMAHQSRIQTTYAHDEARSRFDAFLRAEMDSDHNTYTSAYNEWWSRFRADESGRLEARFHTLNSKYTQELMYGDLPDQSAETREGVTLDAYAKMAVAISRTPNADVDAIAKKHGLEGKAHFDRVNQAWIKAMGEDKTFATTQQYGQLYQKYAGAGFEAEQEEKLANLFAKRNQEPPAGGDEQPDPPSADDYAAELSSPVAKDRWYAARQLAFQCNRYQDFGDKAGSGLERHCTKSAMEKTLVPVIRELEEEYDDRNVSLASGILDLVLELDLGAALGRSTAEGALAKARTRLAELEAEFAPIQHKAVPQKVALRNSIDMYRVSIDEFERHLSDW